MPITPTQIRDRRAKVAFPFAGETVNIEYYAARVMAVTQERAERVQRELMESKDEAEGRRRTAELVIEFIASWDCVEYVNDDGSLGPMIPLDVEHVAPLDPSFLGECILVTFKDAFEGKVNGTPSSGPRGATSSRTAPSTSSRTRSSRPKSSFS